MKFGEIIEREAQTLGTPERPLSVRQLEKLVDDAAHLVDDVTIHYSTFSNWRKGIYGTPNPALLPVIAMAIAHRKYPTMPERRDQHARELTDEMRAAVNLPVGDGPRVLEMDELASLDRTERRAVEEMVRVLHRAKKGHQRSVSGDGDGPPAG